MLLVLDAVWGRKVSSTSSCVAQIHFNGAGDSALIFVRSSNTGGVFIGYELTDCTFVLLPKCALELGTHQWFPMQYEVVISP